VLSIICKKWHLTDMRKLHQRKFSTIYQVTRSTDQMLLILKIGADEKSVAQEASSLRNYNGKVAVRLYEADEKNCALLTELLSPGTDLKELFPKHDDMAIQITTQVINQLHGAAISDVPTLPSLQAWMGDFSCSSGLPAWYLEKAKKLLKKLISSAEKTLLLHGDLHHENILKSDSGGYLAIDPKGIIGDATYEPIPFLLNPMPEILSYPAIEKLWHHRIQLFASLLGFEKARFREWSFVHAMASAGWAVEDKQDPKPWLKLAEIFEQAV